MPCLGVEDGTYLGSRVSPQLRAQIVRGQGLVFGELEARLTFVGHHLIAGPHLALGQPMMVDQHVQATHKLVELAGLLEDIGRPVGQPPVNWPEMGTKRSIAWDGG